MQQYRVYVTEREGQMLTGLFMGLTNPAIGKALGVSEETIKTHMKKLFRKLAVDSRAQAVALVAAGVITVEVITYGRPPNE